MRLHDSGICCIWESVSVSTGALWCIHWHTDVSLKNTSGHRSRPGICNECSAQTKKPRQNVHSATLLRCKLSELTVEFILRRHELWSYFREYRSHIQCQTGVCCKEVWLLKHGFLCSHITINLNAEFPTFFFQGHRNNPKEVNPSNFVNSDHNVAFKCTEV